MGNFCLCQKEVRLILIGIDLAGKTTVMNQLRYKEAKPTTPTVGFNFESIQYKNMNLNIWDTGGQYKIRDLWQHYYEQVVKSYDKLKSLLNIFERVSQLCLSSKKNMY